MRASSLGFQVGAVTRIFAASLACSVVFRVGLAAAAPPARGQDQIATTAGAARVLRKERLDSIYADRTWHWKDGAGYFQAKNREFKAWVGKGRKATYAEGSWTVNNNGRLCFRAAWHSLRGRKRASTCFAHRSDGKNIYQRRLPRGKWYIFSHIPARPGDEINKLQPGDQVSKSYHANKSYVQRARKMRKRR